MRGKLWVTDVSIPGKEKHYDLAVVERGEWQPAPDFNAVRGGLGLLLTRANAAVPATITGYEQTERSQHIGDVLSVDLTRSDQRASHLLPKDKPTDH